MVQARGVPCRRVAAPLSPAWFDRFRTSPRWALLVALANVAGLAYGFWFYLPQLERTPVAYWPFVPDSPLALLGAQLALLAFWLHRRAGRAGEAPGVGAATLDALAFLGCAQMGLWSVYVLTAYAAQLNTFAWGRSLFLLVSHAAMAGLALLFLHGMRTRARARPRAQAVGLALAAAYYLVQDALDYLGPDFMDRGCGLRPHIVPCDPHREMVLAAVTLGLTLVLAAGLAAWLFARRAAPGDAPSAAET